MKSRLKNILITFLLVTALIIPSIAWGMTWVNVKFTVNGQTQVVQVPIYEKTDIAPKTNTVSFTKTRYVYTLEDGKWVLVKKDVTQNQESIPELSKPTTKPTPDPKPVTPEMPKPENPNQTPSEPLEDAGVKGLSPEEQKMVDLVNGARKEAGLEPLKVDMRLVEISRQKSQDMIENNYFAHTSPTYGSPFDVLKNNGVTYRYAGENLAGAPDVVSAHENLMASPGHRANILNPNFNYIGIGIIKGGPYGNMFTQTFIGTK